MPIDLSDFEAALQSKLDAVDPNSQPKDFLLLSKTLEAVRALSDIDMGTIMGLDLTDFRAALQAKLDALVASSQTKDFLLLGKALEATVGSIAVSDLIDAGDVQEVRVQAAGTSSEAAVNAAADARLEEIQNTGGSAVNVTVTPAGSLAATNVQAALAELDAEKAGLDVGGKIPLSLLPEAILGAMNYQGTWNAGTNAPAIPAAASANKGHFYIVATAGSTAVDGASEWQIGDWIVSSGVGWNKIDSSDQVNSVAGLMGTITAAALKIALALAIADVAGLQTALDAKHATSAKASAADLWTGSDDDKRLTSLAAKNSQAIQTITYAATINPNLNGGQKFKVVAEGPMVVGLPANLKEGHDFILYIFQGTTGSHGISHHAAYDFAAAGAPTASTGVNKMDRLYCTVVNATTGSEKIDATYKKAA